MLGVTRHSYGSTLLLLLSEFLWASTAMTSEDSTSSTDREFSDGNSIRGSQHAERRNYITCHGLIPPDIPQAFWPPLWQPEHFADIQDLCEWVPYTSETLGCYCWEPRGHINCGLGIEPDDTTIFESSNMLEHICFQYCRCANEDPERSAEKGKVGGKRLGDIFREWGKGRKFNGLPDSRLPPKKRRQPDGKYCGRTCQLDMFERGTLLYGH